MLTFAGRNGTDFLADSKWKCKTLLNPIGEMNSLVSGVHKIGDNLTSLPLLVE